MTVALVRRCSCDFMDGIGVWRRLKYFNFFEEGIDLELEVHHRELQRTDVVFDRAGGIGVCRAGHIANSIISSLLCKVCSLVNFGL